MAALLTCGTAMEVPDMNPKYTGPSLAHGIPPSILTLARRQHVGLQDGGEVRLGPRDEKKATVGARVAPRTVPG